MTHAPSLDAFKFAFDELIDARVEIKRLRDALTAISKVPTSSFDTDELADWRNAYAYLQKLAREALEVKS